MTTKELKSRFTRIVVGSGGYLVRQYAWSVTTFDENGLVAAHRIEWRVA